MKPNKIATTQHLVHELIRERWSPRSFTEQEISETELHTIIEAGSWAFSASNIQPWRVIAGLRGSETFNRIFDCLMPGNQPWTKHAAALIITVVKTTFDKEGDPHNPTADHDCGAFNATMALQATSMGLMAHPMAGFEAKKVLETFALPANHKPITVMAVGYLDDAEKLEEPYKTRELTERTRKPLTEVVLDL